MPKPRILIPEPTSNDAEYNQRGWTQYAAAVEQAGGIPVAVPLHATQEEQARLMVDALWERIARTTGREIDDIRADAGRRRFFTVAQAIEYGLISERAAER